MICEHARVRACEACRDAALAEAKTLTRVTGRKYVVRAEYTRLYTVPLYAEGQEGSGIDAGYAMLGSVLKESL